MCWCRVDELDDDDDERVSGMNGFLEVSVTWRRKWDRRFIVSFFLIGPLTSRKKEQTGIVPCIQWFNWWGKGVSLSELGESKDHFGMGK